MFYNFAAPRSIAKRRRVNRACDFCRVHRVRCDATTPCAQCVANKISCSRPQPSHASLSREQAYNDESLLSLHPVSRTRASAGKQLNAQAYPPSPDNTRASRPQQQSTETTPATNQLDSTLEFITRINAFCSGVSLLSSQTSSWDDDPGPYRSPFCPGVVDETSSAQCDLSSAQIERLFWVFWARLYPQIPIIFREDLQPLSSQHGNGTPTPTPLQDAVTAYTIQYIFHSGLHSRLLGLQWKQFDTGNRRSRVVGMPYFQRCLTSCTQYAMFAAPSLMTLKCYCIMTLYLLDTGQHHAAYNMIGLAVRIAQSLNLDSAAPPGVHSEEAQHPRIWWTLVHLDFRCSRYAGKSVTAQFSNARVSTPYRLSDSAAGLDSSPYYAQSLRLTYAALAVVESITHHPSLEKDCDVEAQAQALSRELQVIQQWKDAVQKDKYFKHLRLDVLDSSLLEGSCAINVEDDGSNYMSHPPIEIQLNTLLELQYHDTIISLHRGFIKFPSPPLNPRNTPQAESHVATALKHALTIIHIIHSRMSQHDVFYGSSELYQYQWNAVLTLIGFMLAYPSCPRRLTVLRYVDLALETFEFGGRQSDAAARAASFTRYLRDKVDKLSMILNIDRASGATRRRASLVDSSAVHQAAVSLQKDTDFGYQADQGPEDFNLWSWTDSIDPNVWPTYCDEVNEAFAYPPGETT
ncbi:hypothetical protein V1527DRAFT_115327 [Lipomyces starkeyi]